VDARSDRFPLFDSLRGIAALAVIVTHTASFGWGVDPGAVVQPFIGQFAVAVPIFLLISGFLLYRPFVSARLREDRLPSVRLYGLRRVARIVPAYWVALIGIALWLGSHYVYSVTRPPDVFSAEGLLRYFGFTQIYSTDTIGGGIPQAWTVDVEALFYILLPLMALAALTFARRGRRTGLRLELAVFAALYVASFVYKLVVMQAENLHDVPVAPAPLLSALPAWVDHFVLGMALAVASVVVHQRADRPPPVVRVIDRHPWLPWLVALVAFVVVSKGIGLSGVPGEKVSRGQFLARHELYGIVALGLLLPAVFGDQTRGWVRRLLANRALLFFGMVSYGAYLWHLAIIAQLRRWDLGSMTIVHRYVTWLVPTILLAALFGAVSYYVIERPALRAVKGRGRERPDQPGAASAPAAPPQIAR